MTPMLHYIHDPLCGWCYGAAPLIAVARTLLPVRAHGGGMMAGPRRQPVTAKLRDFVIRHDARIAQVSGQPFGAAYVDGLLRDADAVFDSTPPTAAMLAADDLAGRGLDLLAALQVAHFVDGRRIADRDTLVAIASEIGLDAEAFAVAFDTKTDAVLEAHFQETRRWMTRIRAQGFPTLALETGDGLLRVELTPHIGAPERFRARLRDLAGLTEDTAIEAMPARDGMLRDGVTCDERSCVS